MRRLNYVCSMEPALPYGVIERLLTIITVLSGHIYWAKVLTDHPKNCDNCFVVQYFGLNVGTINENTIWHQSYTSAGIWHSACSLRMRIHIKPLKCTCNSRNDLNLNSNHGNLNNKVFFVKMIINWSDKLTHNCQNSIFLILTVCSNMNIRISVNYFIPICKNI